MFYGKVTFVQIILRWPLNLKAVAQKLHIMVFIVDFEHMPHIVLVFLLLILNKKMFAG